MLEIQSTAELHRNLGADSTLVFVIFTARWCSVNQVCQRILAGAAIDYRDRLHVLRIDADRHPELQEELGIRGIPSFLFFRHGTELERLSGSHPRAVFYAAIERNLAR